MYLYYQPEQLGPRFAITNILPPLKTAWELPQFSEPRGFYTDSFSVAMTTTTPGATIRYTLKQFDKHNPDQAVFPESTGTLADDVKQKIYQQSRRGESVDSLSRRFCRTRTTIYREMQRGRFRPDGRTQWNLSKRRRPQSDG